ncbi:MAG: AAA family ATPase [Bacteroidia bacterium]|nr:AAA family ATPase [Bacteroidia bacterium]
MEASNLNQLREAIRLSPENIPLRKVLCEALLKKNLYAEAEAVFRETLKLAPQDLYLQEGLAFVFHSLEKHSTAQVILDELLNQGIDKASIHLLHAKVALALDDCQVAQRSYQIAITQDPSLSDRQLEAAINQKLAEKGLAVPSGSSEDEPDEQPITEIQKSVIRFQDVGGMDEIKDEISLKVIHPLLNPTIYQAYGKKIGGGILLYGPPGCGKTHLARATAGEIDASFISVGIHEVLDMWLGNSEKNLHEIFQTARENAPCVLFFDEIDALAASRSDMRRAEGRFLINQFLDELDGIRHSNDGVLILGATNSPWYLDPAFRRPGRFDRIIFVQPPDQAARVHILKILLQNKPVDLLDYEALAKLSAGYSGADLKAVVDLAIEAKIPESIRQNKVIPLKTNDLKAAIKKHRPSTQEWMATAKNYALYANEGGLYNDLLKYFNLKK